MALSFARKTVKDKNIINKTKNAKTRTSVRTGTNLASQIQTMTMIAESKLAHHKDDYILIRTVEELEECRKAIADAEECAIDTETTGLNPLLVDLVGVCLYVPGKKSAYIPVGHKSHITGQKVQNQIELKDLIGFFNKLKDIKWIFHNAKYDIRVLRHTLGVYLEPYWDTQLGACCIDENESHRLKDLHLKYCDSTDTESLTFDKLFGGITFDLVPIKVAYLYAAGDAIKTYELYQYQKGLLNRRVLSGPYNVFHNIEMPLITVVADMEDRGVCLDPEVCEYLHEKYHKIKEERQQQADEAIAMYKEQIDNYKMKNPNHKLSDPISLTSPTQLAILFYDILGLTSPDKKSPRGTGEEILKHFAKGREKNICEAILGIRNVDKLLNTYIDKMPQIALNDGRVHASYNQYGAKTGRFSSSDPNLQNIPSHNKEIRHMFKAQDGYVLVGGDYSQQEPRLTAHCSNDEKMKESYHQGKDIYATIASLAFDKSYEECKEFREDGTVNPEGKERRSQAKAIVLGVTYGKGIPAIGEDLGISTQKAQAVYDKVMESFPMLEKFMHDTQEKAREHGYVETPWGRRRHLKDMQLEPYIFKYDGKVTNFDPLAFGSDVSTEVPERIKKEYTKKLDKCRFYKERIKVENDLHNQGISVAYNTNKIAQAERQCVNSVIQGGAADMAKLAMIHINNDERMKELDFHLLIQVHDEVIGECPIENAKEASKRLAQLMIDAPKGKIDIPMKVDCEITKNWYGESVEV